MPNKIYSSLLLPHIHSYKMPLSLFYLQRMQAHLELVQPQLKRREKNSIAGIL